MNSKSFQRIRYVPFFVGLLWLFSLDRVCVTTQEFKPRGTFMSEYSLLPGTAGNDHWDSDWLEPLSFSHLESLSTGKYHPLFIKGGIARAKTANDRRETICIVSKENHGDDILMALSKTLIRVNWLSKDVIFLVLPENESFYAKTNILREWLNSYLLDGQNDTITRRGPIRAAVFLDVEGTPSHRFDNYFSREIIQVHGRNGRIPNLDLINVAHKTSIPDLKSSLFENPSEDAIDWKFLQGVYFGRDMLYGTNGWHAEFLDYGIESLTLKLTSDGSGHFRTNKVHYALRIEAIVRSLSNLGERFNRGFFFFIMLGLDNFVSIDEYLWVFLLLLSPFAIDGFVVAFSSKIDNFLKTRRALVSLGLAFLLGAFIIPGLAILLPKVPLVFIWGFVSLLFIFSQREWVSVLNEHNSIYEHVIPPWRFRKVANEVFLFISLSAVSIIHFPLGLVVGLIQLFSSHFVVSLSTSITKFLMMNFILLATSVPLFYMDSFTPIQLSLDIFKDLNSFVFFCILLPSQLVNFSIIYSKS